MKRAVSARPRSLEVQFLPFTVGLGLKANCLDLTESLLDKLGFKGGFQGLGHLEIHWTTYSAWWKGCVSPELRVHKIPASVFRCPEPETEGAAAKCAPPSSVTGTTAEGVLPNGQVGLSAPLHGLCSGFIQGAAMKAEGYLGLHLVVSGHFLTTLESWCSKRRHRTICHSG